MYTTKFMNGRKFVTRHITEQYKYEMMLLPNVQQDIINSQIDLLIRLDFKDYANDEDKYELFKLLKENSYLLELVDIPREYIYRLKRNKTRRH